MSVKRGKKLSISTCKKTKITHNRSFNAPITIQDYKRKIKNTKSQKKWDPVDKEADDVDINIPCQIPRSIDAKWPYQ